MILYHGTKTPEPVIRREGLKPQTPSIPDLVTYYMQRVETLRGEEERVKQAISEAFEVGEFGVVFLSDDPKEAALYAVIGSELATAVASALPQDLRAPFIRTLLNPQVNSNLVAVDLPGDWPISQPTGEGEVIQVPLSQIASLEEAATTRAIPPELITEIRDAREEFSREELLSLQRSTEEQLAES